MATFDEFRPASVGLRHRILSILSRAFAGIAAWNDRRATRKALGKLSNRQLDDIGLCRGDIDLIA